MTERLRRAGQVAWAGVGIAALLTVLGVVAWYVRVVFPPLILAGAIVFLLNPVVSALQRRGVPRALGAALAYVAVLGIIALAALGVSPLVADQVDELSEEWPAIRADIEAWVDARALDSQGTFFEFDRDELTDAVSNSGGSLEDQLAQARDVGVQVFHVLLVLVLGPVVGFYLLVDTPHLRRVSEGLIPRGARDEVLHVAHRLNRAMGGFFRGQLMVALIVGVLASIGLFAIGLRFWFLIGMIAGLFNIIPLIGPWVGGIPGLVVALTTGSVLQAVGVIVVMVVVQQIDNHAITPYVMQRAVQLHPAVVVLALLAGGSLFGFGGLLLAVPATAALKIVVGHLWRVHVLGEPFHDAPEGSAREGLVAEVDDRPENQGGGDPVPALAGGPSGGAPAAESRP